MKTTKMRAQVEVAIDDVTKPYNCQEWLEDVWFEKGESEDDILAKKEVQDAIDRVFDCTRWRPLIVRVMIVGKRSHQEYQVGLFSEGSKQVAAIQALLN